MSNSVPYLCIDKEDYVDVQNKLKDLQTLLERSVFRVGGSRAESKKNKKEEKGSSRSVGPVKTITKDKKEKGKARKKKDNNGVKNPRSAFILWSMNERTVLRAEGCTLGAKDMIVLLADKWRGLEEEKKKHWQEFANKEKNERQQMMMGEKPDEQQRTDKNADKKQDSVAENKVAKVKVNTEEDSTKKKQKHDKKKPEPEVATEPEPEPEPQSEPEAQSEEEEEEGEEEEGEEMEGEEEESEEEEEEEEDDDEEEEDDEEEDED